MQLEQFSKSQRERINTFLANTLTRQTSIPTRLLEAIQYMLLGDGKRVRPLLVYATGQALGAKFDDLDYIAAALECQHIYSLIHDDLPAMDNDDLRHGKPACHKQFDEALAILCGDALQSFGFELLANAKLSVKPETQVALLKILAHAVGPQGMVAGQVLDMAAQGKAINQTELATIHKRKTGALINAAIRMGALASENANEQQLLRLQQFADYLGLMFQIHDDIIDIESSTEKLGKLQGADINSGKATYPALIGLDNAKKLEKEYYDIAINALAQCQIDQQSDSDILMALAKFFITREY